MANYQFPMEGMMGPSTPIDRITAGSSMFTPGQGKVPTAGEQVVAGEARDKYFQELLNRLKGAGAAAAPVIGAVGKYGAATAPGVQSMLGGDILGGAAQVAAGAGVTRAAAPLGAAVTRGAAAALPGPLKAAAPFIGGATQALAGTIASAATGAGIDAAKAAVGNIPSAQRESGQTPGVIPGTSAGGVGLSNLTGEQKQIAELMRLAGVNIPVEQAQAMLPIANQMKDADMQRQMQLNQQLGQLTGALNRQQYAFQLAGGAQSQAGENLRTMMTSNPYASSTFRY